MKTKELIKQLQEADPTGEEEVCIDNEDILFVSKFPAYYDGCFQVLKRDPTKAPYYNVIGIEIKSYGSKIRIYPHGIEMALLDHPEMPITFDTNYAKEHYEERVEQLRQEYRELENETGGVK